MPARFLKNNELQPAELAVVGDRYSSSRQLRESCRERTPYSVIEIVVEAKDMMLVSRVMPVDVLQKLYLIKTLVKEVLVVFYDLHADIHASVQVMRLDSFTEGR